MSSLAHVPRGRPRDAQLAERRRAQILDAAARLFARRGYADADVQELADRLKVGKGTVYRYFPSKQALFLASVDRGMRRLKAEVDVVRANASEPLELIARAVGTYLTFFDAHPEFVELLIQERAVFKDRKTLTYFEHRQANQGRWVELFGGLIADGRIRRMPAEQITEVVGNLLYGTMFTNHFAGRRKSPARQAREILDVVFHGLLTTRERTRGPRSSVASIRHNGHGKSRPWASDETRRL